jgi:hypothetical protein
MAFSPSRHTPNLKFRANKYTYFEFAVQITTHVRNIYKNNYSAMRGLAPSRTEGPRPQGGGRLSGRRALERCGGRIITAMSEPQKPETQRPTDRRICDREDAVICERCGAEMFRMHAVWRCPNCRFKTDCCGW